MKSKDHISITGGNHKRISFIALVLAFPAAAACVVSEEPQA